VSVTYTGAQTAGNTNVIAIGWNDNTSSVTSVTDTNGNAYTLAVGAAGHSLPKLLFPFLDLRAEYPAIKEELQTAVERVLESQQFIMGPDVGQLEAKIAALIGCSFAVACASGSDALLLALMALGVDAGDEVITTPFTFVATAGSISRLKAKPVFVDIDRETYNLDAKHLEAAITDRTKAIIPVHLFGLPAEMAKITEISRAHHLPVIEDAAQAIGSQYRDRYVGSLGACGCFSFFPLKEPGRGRRWRDDHNQRSRFCRASLGTARSRQPKEVSVRLARHQQLPRQPAGRDPTG
jgi:hypothetical protein